MKILLIRFSSIGDIVLTSPVVRSLKVARPGWELHYLSKSQYRDLLIYNPYLSQVHEWGPDPRTTLKALKAEGFDFVLDLHHNLRSLRVKMALRVHSKSFPKQNLDKYLLVHAPRWARPIRHVVERYGETLQPLGLSLDEQGLDFYLPPDSETTAATYWQGFEEPPAQCLAVALGAQYATKRWLPEYFVKTLNVHARPVVLLGGKDTQAMASHILPQLKVPVMNLVGKASLLAAAAVMRSCRAVLTHDSGFMHIAAAFHLPIVSLWGNTVPALGMTPYRTAFEALENRDLSCRPCSKIGHHRCPRGHFNCMRALMPEQVIEALGNTPSV